MRVGERPSERLAEVSRPGTYRMACGHLLHCHPVAGGALLVLVESEAACPPTGPSSECLVKLSDDPDWPDHHMARVALLAFD